MSMPGSPATGGPFPDFNLEMTPQVIVYGPDGTMYPNPAAARAAGVTNSSMQQPQTGIGGATPMPEVGGGGGGIDARAVTESPSAFSKGGRIRNPELPGFRNPDSFEYGYSAPMPMQPLQMPSSMQMPSMNLQAPEGGIVDPTYLAQLEILNQGGMNQPMGLLGSGLGPQERGPVAPFLTIPDYRPMAQQFRKEDADAAAAARDRDRDRDSGGGGGGGGDFFRGNPSLPGNDFSVPGDDDYMGYDPGGDYSLPGNDDYMGYESVSQPGNDNYMGYTPGGSPGSQPGDDDYMGYDPGGGGGGGGSKIVCTAMNEAYGFGSFRNRIWLAYAAKNLTKAHEAGYHALFLPLVSAGYKQDKWFSKPLRAALENIARHRSADLRAEMRGGKRDRVGQAYRFILEPLCYAVGKLKGN